MTDTTSPLAEVDPLSLDILFDRINAKLIQGMPETIDDEKDIAPVVRVLIAKRQQFLTLQAQQPPPKTRKVKGAPVESVAQAMAAFAKIGDDEDE